MNECYNNDNHMIGSLGPLGGFGSIKGEAQ